MAAADGAAAAVSVVHLPQVGRCRGGGGGGLVVVPRVHAEWGGRVPVGEVLRLEVQRGVGRRRRRRGRGRGRRRCRSGGGEVVVVVVVRMVLLLLVMVA